MGLIVDIFRDGGRPGCANGGVSDTGVQSLTIVNVEGPFDPTPARPGAVLVRGHLTGTVHVVPLDAAGRLPVPHTAMGGCFVHTSDSRFGRAVELLTGSRFYGAVALHDRLPDGGPGPD